MENMGWNGKIVGFRIMILGKPRDIGTVNNGKHTKNLWYVYVYGIFKGECISTMIRDFFCDVSTDFGLIWVDRHDFSSAQHDFDV